MFNLRISIDTNATPRKEYAAHVLEQLGNQYESITVWNTDEAPYIINLEGRSSDIVDAIRRFDAKFPEIIKDTDKALFLACANKGVCTQPNCKRIA